VGVKISGPAAAALPAPEDDTLVIDVTNFSPKTDFQGARENLHLVERWTRTGPATLEYVVTAEDPTVWTKPWTALQTFTRQSDQENKVHYEPRCIEGNYGLPMQMRGRRQEEAAFAAGRRPDPATHDNTHGSLVLDADPLVWGRTGELSRCHSRAAGRAPDGAPPDRSCPLRYRGRAWRVGRRA
jgi:hypothetical protein